MENTQEYTIRIIEEVEKRFRPVVTFPNGSKEAFPTYKTAREALGVATDYILSEGPRA